VENLGRPTPQDGTSGISSAQMGPRRSRRRGSLGGGMEEEAKWIRDTIAPQLVTTTPNNK